MQPWSFPRRGREQADITVYVCEGSCQRPYDQVPLEGGCQDIQEF
jgi:hypothetical protein